MANCCRSRCNSVSTAWEISSELLSPSSSESTIVTIELLALITVGSGGARLLETAPVDFEALASFDAAVEEEGEGEEEGNGKADDAGDADDDDGSEDFRRRFGDTSVVVDDDDDVEEEEEDDDDAARTADGVEDPRCGRSSGVASSVLTCVRAR